MQPETTVHGLQQYLSFIGTFVQLGGIVLLVVLFLLVRRYARRRLYFRIWSHAWAALALALLAIIVQYDVLPAAGARTLHIKLTSFVYQSSRLAFCALLLAGTLRYVRSAPRLPSLTALATFISVYAALSVLLSGQLSALSVLQSLVAIACLGYCAWLMLGLPASRQSLGSSISGGFLTFGAVVWSAYFLAFSFAGTRPDHPLVTVVNYRSYFDLFWQLSLAFGMVVLLMEDLKHEVDAAHAELAVAHDNLLRASFYDSVTGSLNRQAFAEGLGLEAARAGFGAVLMLDMDNLKDVNDAHGHAAGDALLRYMVETLRSALRPSDKLYRFGGDEFLIIFPGGEAPQIARRIKSLVQDAEPFQLRSGAMLQLKVSAGAASYASAEELNAAIDAADRAMYADKLLRKRPDSDEADVAQTA